jgi:hypothetical protein
VQTHFGLRVARLNTAILTVRKTSRRPADFDALLLRTIVETGALRGRNAGAEWLDQEVVVDGNLVSSRKPDAIPAFNQAMIGFLAERVRRRHRRSETGACPDHPAVRGWPIAMA